MNKHNRLTKDLRTQIEARIKEGLSNKAIAAEFGLVPQHVNYYRNLPNGKKKVYGKLGLKVDKEVAKDLAKKQTPTKTKVAQAVSRVLTGPRILTFDIETLPLESYTWGLFDQNVGLNQIKTDWAALSIAAKWLGDDEVWYEDTSKKATIRDDKDMIAKLCAMLDEADIVVGQNVKKFDLRKIRARALMHGLQPFREPLVQDTMLMARSIGAFTSNKLEYLTSNLTDAKKSKHQKFPGFDLWLGVMQGNPEAWAEMKAYNIQDVISTEELYLKLRPWVRNHPNMAHYYNDDHVRCPRCGSVNVYPTEVEYRGVSEYQGYCCRDCEGHSRSRYTLNSKAKRRNLLTCI